MKNIIFSSALIALFIFSGCSASSEKAGFDTLITGGTIYDGTVRDPYVADIGIIGDRIAAIGDLSGGTAKKTIDAKGLIVTPGFIDVHNHTDLNVLMALIMSGKEDDLSMITPGWKENRNYSTQGVTTIVTGLCGGGFWDVDKWLGLIDSVKFGANVYHMIPYGMLRQQLFGDNQPTALTASQLNTLKDMVEKEMKNGALGVSVGLEYAPDCFTTTDELVEIAKVVNRYGGIYDAHIRDQTGTMHENGQPGELNSIKETIEIGKRSGIPVHISHIQLNLPWNDVESKQMHDLIEQARAEGMDITADQHPYDAGYSILSYRLPAEFKTGLGVNERYKTPEGKAQMREAVKKVFTFLGPEKITLISGPEKYRNKTIREIAEMEGKDPAEVYVDLSCLEPAPFALFLEISDKVNREIMPHDYVFTASDGFTVFEPEDSPHPRFFGCFPRKIKKYALEEKLLSLNDAIRSMTSLPAAKFNIRDRGMIAVGKFADIAVIDLENFTDRATYAERSRYSEGVVYLLVNGELSIDNGKLTGKRGGRALRLNR